jgi:RNA polymerase sigma factor (sigma-70 family)
MPLPSHPAIEGGTRCDNGSVILAAGTEMAVRDRARNGVGLAEITRSRSAKGMCAGGECGCRHLVGRPRAQAPYGGRELSTSLAQPRVDGEPPYAENGCNVRDRHLVEIVHDDHGAPPEGKAIQRRQDEHARLPAVHRLVDIGSLVCRHIHSADRHFTTVFASMRTSEPERDAEQVRPQWTCVIVSSPSPVKRQEHLLRQVLDIRGTGAEASQGGMDVVELSLEGVQTGPAGIERRSGGRSAGARSVERHGGIVLCMQPRHVGSGASSTSQREDARAREIEGGRWGRFGSVDFRGHALFFSRARQLSGSRLMERRAIVARIDGQNFALHAPSMLRLIKAAAPGDVEGAPQAEARSVLAQTELDDRARAALGGEPAALRNFLTAVVPIVRRVCYGVMGRDNPELEDAIQDCLIDIARALPQFRFDGKASHYVTKIAMRRAIACRQRARDRSKQQATLEPFALAAATFDAARETRADLVRNLLDALNEEQAKALLLHVMLGHSTEEIAVITGVSVNTVKTRLRLGKEQLRRWLQRSGEGRRSGG